MRAIAERQHAVVARKQAYECGFTKPQLQRLVASGRWEWFTPRVLCLVGAPKVPLQALMAATLDGGPGTVASRRAAAALWEVPGYRVGEPDVARQRGQRSRPPSIGTLHLVRYLPPHLTTVRLGIPVVSLPYLLFQLAGIERPERTERLLDTIITRSPGVLVRMHQLLPELSERGRNGIVVMRDLLKQRPVGTRVVASGLEYRFQRLLIDAGERPLRRQIDLGGHEWIGRVDFVDDELPLIFEVDSEVHHLSKVDQERDRERDDQLIAAGFVEAVRIAEEWIWYEPDKVSTAVRDARRRHRHLRRSGT